MRGLDRLIEARRNGLKPAGLVKVATDPECYAYDGWVVRDAGDKAASTDLRPFVGLSVMVCGSDFKTVDAWARSIAEAGAKSVGVVITASEAPSMDDAAILKHNGEMLA